MKFIDQMREAQRLAEAGGMGDEASPCVCNPGEWADEAEALAEASAAVVARWKIYLLHDCATGEYHPFIRALAQLGKLLEASSPPERTTPEPAPARDPLQKRPTWFFSMEMDQDPIACLGDDVPHALSIIRDQIEGDMTLIFDGDIATYQLKRVDMSDVEVEALPEI